MSKLLVTGAGSLAREIISQSKGVGLSNDEDQIVQCIRDFPDSCFVVCDIRDKDSLANVVRVHQVTHLIHTAALKHVSICEENINEAILTNIQGSRNIIEVAQENNIRKVLAVSSDKSVAPLNVYGATKLIMEKMFLKAGFSVVRFGNFWGSRGSVIPLWEEEKKTGTITITDPEATRFFIQLEDAARMCINCVENMGELTVPTMLEFTLGQLAEMVAPDANWNIIGLQDGEKKHEVLK